MRTVKILGKEFTVELCTADDVKPHYEKIRHWVSDVTEVDFKRRMLSSINEGHAFKISDNSCFLYYIEDTPRIAEGVAFYGKNSPLSTVALVTTVFPDMDPETFIIKFALHKGKSINEYRGILTKKSVVKAMRGISPLIVRVDHLTEKFKGLITSGQ